MSHGVTLEHPPCGTCGNIGLEPIASGLRYCAAGQGWVRASERRDCAHRMPHIDPSSPSGTWHGLQGWHRRALLEMANNKGKTPGVYPTGFMGAVHDKLVDLGLATAEDGRPMAHHEGAKPTKRYTITAAGRAVVAAGSEP